MPSKKPNILMIVENSFPRDPRVRKEAYHLSQEYDITVIAIKKSIDTFYEKHEGITIFRMPEIPDIDLSKLRYMLEYFYFTLISTCLFLCTLPFKRYKVVHVHNPPDTLFVVAILCKVLRIKFIFDHHDLAPNLYRTRFSNREDLIYKTLIFCERMSCRLADVVIATNETYKQLECDRHGIDPAQIFVVRNNPIIEDCVLENVNSELVKSKKEKEKKVLLFIGAINPQDGMVELLQIVDYLVNTLNEKDIICNIVGGGDSLEPAKKAAIEMGLAEYTHFTGPIIVREKVKEQFYLADVGLEPAPANELNNHSTFIKIMEYMAAKLPIVAFDLKETRYSTNGNALLIPPGDIAGFAGSIQKLLNDEKLGEELAETSFKRVAEELNWESATKTLDEAYSKLAL